PVPVDRDAEVKLLRDVGGLLHQHPRDPVAAHVHAEDALSLPEPALRIVGQLNAAGLAPAPDAHLGLGLYPAADLLCNRARLFRRSCDAAHRHRDPGLGEDGLRLAFDQLHLAVYLLAVASTTRRKLYPNWCW